MPAQHLSTVERLRSLAARDAREIARLREALAFARSVIKSGEPWTPECDRDHRRCALRQHLGGALMAEGCPECEARKASGRQRTAKWRAKGKGDATVTPRRDITAAAYKGEAAGDVTPPPPARHSVPPKTPPSPPKGGSPSVPSVRAAPKPNKSREVIDLLKAAGLPHQLEKSDHQAVKASPLSPAQIVEAFGAVYHGEWGGEWLRTQNLNVQAVIKRYAGYLSWKERPAAPTNGVTNGVTHQPNSLKPNRRPDYVPVFTHDLERIDPGVAQRALAQASRTPLKEKLAQVRGGGK